MVLGDMARPLCGLPVGTISNAQVGASAVVPAELLNKTPIYVSGVTNTRRFLIRLSYLCPSPPAQIKEETLMIIPRASDGSRATVTALRSLDWLQGCVSTLSPGESVCASAA
jgi:hypothetical protein